MTAKPPTMNATSVSKRLRAAGVDVMRVKAMATTCERDAAGAFVEAAGYLWVCVPPAWIEPAADQLRAAGYAVEVAGSYDLHVTAPAAPAAEVVDLAVVEVEAEPARCEVHGWVHRFTSCADAAGTPNLPANAEPLQLAAFPLPEVAGQLDLADVDEHLADELVVVTCTGPKLDQPAPAGRLYTGASHKLPREAAAAIAERTGARVAIVSALHGLLDLDQLVAPYEQQLGKPGAVEAATVAGQLRAAGVRRVVALTSNPYAALLAEAARLAGVELVAPLAGCRGIGEQRGRLARLRDGRPLAA